MISRSLKFFVILPALLFSLNCRAQDSLRVESRPVFAVYSIGIGKSFALDTYLSPLRYDGPSFSIKGLWQKAFTKRPDRWSMHFEASAEFSWLKGKPSGNASVPELDVEFDWGAQRRFHLPAGVILAPGAAMHTEAGLLYAVGNGNNPVSAKGFAAISLTADAYYDFHIGRLPVRLSDRVALPAVGAFFSPAFCETYYEIYLGNHDGLVHPAWWGNHFSIRNTLAVDLDLGRTSLRLGYGLNYRSSFVNHLNYHVATHSFIIGFTPGGLGIKHPRCQKPGVNVVTPFN